MKTITEFYEQIYNLQSIVRYSLVPKIKNETVAEHSFFVASLVVALHEEYNFDLGKALTMAIVHDWTESWTDDICVVTKRRWPKLNEVMSEIELEIAKSEFPESAYEAWREYKLSDWPSIEIIIVHYADVLQCVQYAKSELKMGNNGYMKDVYETSLDRISKLEKELHVYKKQKLG